MPSTPSPHNPGDLPPVRSRDALEALLVEEFQRDRSVRSRWPPGRGSQVGAGATDHFAGRNHLNGAVTGLSPYIRHGVLTLAEVKQAVFENRIRKRDDGGKLINELGWRDFWQRMWLDLGDGIHDDQEAFKTGHDASSYARELPQDVRDGCTGLACMDGFRDELVTTGWLHNHARMWMAAWLVHWRRVHWTAGANWFLEHLLDGDPANNLSWQWVASSFNTASSSTAATWSATAMAGTAKNAPAPLTVHLRAVTTSWKASCLPRCRPFGTPERDATASAGTAEAPVRLARPKR